MNLSFDLLVFGFVVNSLFFFFPGNGDYDCPLQFHCDECKEERL